MPRRKRTELDHDFIYDRWKIFGNWLTLQRQNKGITQNEAAQALKISRQQWMRYELGSKVLKKRIPAIAEALDLSLEKTLDRSGYRASRKLNAAKDRLGRIHNLLCAGQADLAILELLRLNDRITGAEVGRRRGGVEATNFARAMILLDGLPGWLLEETLETMRGRVADKKKNEAETHPRVKRLVRRQCVEARRDV